jgi:hypothetical protein
MTRPHLRHRNPRPGTDAGGDWEACGAGDRADVSEVGEGRVVMIHKLVDDAVVREPEGIAARCECGWKSGHHFTAMAASAAFLAHQESVAESERRTCPTS